MNPKQELMAFAIIEISTLVIAIIIAVVLYKILKKGTQLAMNAVPGILVLLAARFLFGAFLIIILNYFRIAITKHIDLNYLFFQFNQAYKKK
jgi:hypothetical protein